MDTRPPLFLLETLLAVSRAQSLEEAAARLGSTQPTVSRQLRQLQEHFHVPLFQNVGKSKRLTPAALQLCAELGVLFGQVEQRLRSWEQSQGRVENIRLRVGGPAELLARLLRQAPVSPAIEAVPSTSVRALDAVRARELDLAVGTEIEDRLDLVARRIHQEDFALVHALKGETSPAKLRNFLRAHPLLAYRPDLPALTQLLKAFLLKPEDLRWSHEIADWRTLLGLAEAGQGWLYLPEGLVPTGGKLRRVALPPAATYRSSLYLASRKELSALPWFRTWSRGLTIT